VEPSLIRIVADVNERRSGIPAALTQLGARIELRQLRAGDYAISADVLVERKSVGDLHAAIAKGTVWPQIGKLRRAAKYPFFLVEGPDLDSGRIAPAGIRGVCLAVIEQGIRLIRTSDRDDSALGFIASPCDELPCVTIARHTLRAGSREARARQPKRCSPPCRASQPQRRGRCWLTLGPSGRSWLPIPKSGSKCRASDRTESRRYKRYCEATEDGFAVL
jgi:ERCC4 domain